MGAVIRFFAAVHRGQVVASCATLRHYRFAVLHFHTRGGRWPIAVTWRTTFEGAQRALLLNRSLRKQIVDARQTTSLLPIGTSVDVVELERLYQLSNLSTLNQPGGTL